MTNDNILTEQQITFIRTHYLDLMTRRLKPRLDKENEDSLLPPTSSYSPPQSPFEGLEWDDSRSLAVRRSDEYLTLFGALEWDEVIARWRAFQDSLDYSLNEQQFAFMKRHHDEIRLSHLSSIFSDGAPWIGEYDVIDDLLHSDEYKEVFGDMGWDDAYDRYQDTPGYEWPAKLDDDIDVYEAVREEIKQLRIRLNLPPSHISDQKD